MKIKLLASEVLRLSRFGLVGLLASSVHILVAAVVLSWYSHWHEAAVNLLAYGFAFIVSLLGHQWFTFQKRAKFFRFLIMSLFSLAVNNLMLFFALKLGMSGVYAIAPAVVVAAGSSYLLARCWVFHASASGVTRNAR